MRNVRTGLLAAAFCVLGAVHLVSSASLTDNDNRQRQHLNPVEHHKQNPSQDVPRRTRSAEHWLSLISEIARLGAMHELQRTTSSGGSTIYNNIFLPSPVKLAGENSTVQFVLVPVAAGAATGHYNQNLNIESTAPNFSDMLFNTKTGGQTLFGGRFEQHAHDYGSKYYTTPQPLDREPVSSSVYQDIPFLYKRPTSRPETEDQVSHTMPFFEESRTTARPTTRQPLSNKEYEVSSFPVRIPTIQPPSTDTHDVNDIQSYKVPQTHFHLPHENSRPWRLQTFGPVEDSQQLLLQFRAQMPRTPSLPPVVIEPLVVNYADDNVVEVPDPTQEVSSSSSENSSFNKTETAERCERQCKETSKIPKSIDAEQSLPSPPLPRFERSMMIEAVLTVPRADYSEPYTLSWDAASGASRIDHHGGTASSYRIMRLDGKVQSVHIQIDRTGDTDVRRCTVLKPRRVTLAERQLPVLPDLSGFKFAGYIDVKSVSDVVKSRVERWVHTNVAGIGTNGASRGEVLTYRHELLVARAQDNLTTTPLRYAVAVDSSVLGENCDSYIHRFLKVYSRHHDPAEFSVDPADACTYIERTDKIEVVEPLREFSLLQRSPKYDDLLKSFQKQHRRQYADDLEETIRKNVLIQSSRFTSSGNRKGASFELELNMLSDRLRVEMEPLYGIDANGTGDGDKFPHAKGEVKRMSNRLPQKFDWRELGGVTPVRFQNNCSSCWAFSVVGAVEGALFARTRRLVPLSEQALVDCGHRTGARGCKPSWPKAAYDYIRDNGLPALDEYKPYVAKEQQCTAERVVPVTRISGHTAVPRLDLVALKVAIRKHGPTVILIDGDTPSLHSYKKGFYHDAKCQKNKSSHAVLAVGWTVHRGETYFILKNSWSAGWGDGGYVYMRAKTNTCGMLRMPSYPNLQRNNVLRVPTSARSARSALPSKRTD